jgi:hypothetical protein
MKFNVGDILINAKVQEYHDKIELYYFVVDIDDTYTWVKRLDSPDSHKPVRYPTQNMDWFFNFVSRAE